MKKTIMTIIAIMMVMTLVSCGKESVSISHSAGNSGFSSHEIEEVVVDTTVFSEIEFEGTKFHNVKLSSEEYLDLMEKYADGKISKECVEETLYNSQTNNWH